MNKQIKTVKGKSYEMVPCEIPHTCIGCVALDSGLCDKLIESAFCLDNIWKEKGVTEPKKYLVSEVLEAVDSVTGNVVFWAEKEICSWLENRESPEYQQYLELKKKFEK